MLITGAWSTLLVACLSVNVLAFSAQDQALLEKHSPFGLPSAGEILVRDGYVLSHNNWLKIPNWVAYRASTATVHGAAIRKDNFRADPDLKPWQRSEPSDYKRSGYDQGHMAPAAAMKWSETAMSESFLLSNMAPQVGIGFNRGIWRILEDKVRQWAVERGEGYVLVGPAFYDTDGDGIMSFRLIGKSKVAVPTHCFMILVTKDKNGKLDSIAFLLPNTKLRDDELAQHIVSIHDIERLTGLDFLNKLPEGQQDDLEGARAVALWP
jgi:endonuclease G